MKLKEISSVIILIMVSFSRSDGQFLKDFGIRGGFTISRIEVSDIRRPSSPFDANFTYQFIDEPVINPTVSLFATLLRTEIVDLQSDLSYVRRGGRRTEVYLVTTVENPDGNGTTATLTSEIGVQYVGLDLLVKPHLEVGGMELSLQAGPTVSYLVQTSGLVEFGGNISRWQLGYLVGGGVDPGALLGFSLFVDVSYAADFKYFYDASIAKYSNRTWTMTIGARL